VETTPKCEVPEGVSVDGGGITLGAASADRDRLRVVREMGPPTPAAFGGHKLLDKVGYVVDVMANLCLMSGAALGNRPTAFVAT
jgi:hypothetical protein